MKKLILLMLMLLLFTACSPETTYSPLTTEQPQSFFVEFIDWSTEVGDAVIVGGGSEKLYVCGVYDSTNGQEFRLFKMLPDGSDLIEIDIDGEQPVSVIEGIEDSVWVVSYEDGGTYRLRRIINGSAELVDISGYVRDKVRVIHSVMPADAPQTKLWEPDFENAMQKLDNNSITVSGIVSDSSGNIYLTGENEFITVLDKNGDFVAQIDAYDEEYSTLARLTKTSEGKIVSVGISADCGIKLQIIDNGLELGEPVFIGSEDGYVSLHPSIISGNDIAVWNQNERGIYGLNLSNGSLELLDGWWALDIEPKYLSNSSCKCGDSYYLDWFDYENSTPKLVRISAKP